jgi:hypothetical protein
MTGRQTRGALVALAVLLGGVIGGTGVSLSTRDTAAVQHAVVAKTPRSASHKPDAPLAAILSGAASGVSPRVGAVLVAPQHSTTRARIVITARGPPVFW